MAEVLLTDSSGNLTPVLKILTDYPRDDLAHDEVHQSLVTACVRHRVNAANLDVGAVPGLDTVVAGFKTAQLIFTSALGYGHVFHTNCAPRKNIVSVRSAGEKIVLGMTSTGVALLAVNAGYALAPFQEAVEAGEMAFFQTSVRDEGSQFRSRDYFPDAMAELAAHLAARLKELGVEKVGDLLATRDFATILKGLSYVGEPLASGSFPQLPQGAVFYIDNFGNIKLNYRHSKLLKSYPAGTVLDIALGNTVRDAVVGDAGFSQGEGVLAVTGGSSGGKAGAFSEIFLRGGRAAGHFAEFRTGDPVLALRKEDLQQVIGILRGADRETSERLELHNDSEFRIIRMLGRAGLIRNGFDTDALQESLAKGDLLKRLTGGK